MNRDRLVAIVTQLFAAALFVVSLIGLVVALQDGEGLVSALFAVYLTGLLLGGVLRDATRTRGWQLAFFVGVTLWGGWEFAVSGDWISLLLAAVGVVMVAANLLEIR